MHTEIFKNKINFLKVWFYFEMLFVLKRKTISLTYYINPFLALLIIKRHIYIRNQIRMGVNNNSRDKTFTFNKMFL